MENENPVTHVCDVKFKKDSSYPTTKCVLLVFKILHKQLIFPNIFKKGVHTKHKFKVCIHYFKGLDKRCYLYTRNYGTTCEGFKNDLFRLGKRVLVLLYFPYHGCMEGNILV